MQYYMTFCEHHIRAGFPVICVHGSLTSTGEPLGPAYRGFLIYDASSASI